MAKQSKSNGNEDFKALADAIERTGIALAKGLWVIATIIYFGMRWINWRNREAYVDAVYFIFLPAIALTALKNKVLAIPLVFGFFPEVMANAILQVPWPIFWAILSGLGVLIAFFALGLGPYKEKRAFQQAIDSLNFKNGTGIRPKVKSIRDEGDFKKVVLVSSYGIGPKAYREKIDNLQSSIEGIIGSIERAQDSKFVEIIINRKKMPSKVNFQEVAPALQRPGQFVVGKSNQEVVTERIDALPHLLIAGTTGGGKSVFFKQALLGLLESTDSLQMYLIDLKGGLEFRPFAALPNVVTVKSIEEATSLLKRIKAEMQARFDYLEEQGKDKIDPKTDKLDRIVVGIDEASVLYSTISADDEDHAKVAKARGLTEHIAKLSRAAGVHLVMATQRVTKETIDTRIQENISGRMCFKVNTLEGSLRMLGNKAACELPAIPGRGIWQLGHQMVEVQTPYVDNTILQKRLAMVKKQYESGEKKIHKEMLKIDSSDLNDSPKLDEETNTTRRNIEQV